MPKLVLLPVLFCASHWLAGYWQPKPGGAYARMMVAQEERLCREWGWDLTIGEMEELRQEDVPFIFQDSPVPTQLAPLETVESTLGRNGRISAGRKPTLALFYLDVAPVGRRTMPGWQRDASWRSCIGELIRTEVTSAPREVHRLNTALAIACRQGLRGCDAGAVGRLLLIPVPQTVQQPGRGRIESQLDRLGIAELPCVVAYLPRGDKGRQQDSPVLLARPSGSTYRTVFGTADVIASRLAQVADEFRRIQGVPVTHENGTNLSGAIRAVANGSAG